METKLVESKRQSKKQEGCDKNLSYTGQIGVVKGWVNGEAGWLGKFWSEFSVAVIINSSTEVSQADSVYYMTASRCRATSLFSKEFKLNSPVCEGGGCRGEKSPRVQYNASLIVFDLHYN